MARSARRLPRRGGWESASSTVTLALLQLRQTWRLLVVAGTGILIAVVLVCAVPLYSQGAMNQGLRNTLNATTGGSYVTIHGVPIAPVSWSSE